MERVHRLQDVVCQVAVGPVEAFGPEGAGHVCDAEAAAVECVAVAEGHLPPLLGLWEVDLHGSAEGVGVGDAEAAEGAVDLDPGELCAPDVEAGRYGARRAAVEVHYPDDVGGYVYFDLLAVLGFAGDGPLGEGDLGGGLHLPDGSYEVDEGCEVVGAHVEHGAAPFLVVEAGVGVPALVSVAGHEAVDGDGFPDEAVVDDLPAGLYPSAEEGVRCSADEDACFPGYIDEFFTVCEVDGEGFLVVGGLARLYSLFCYLVVGVGGGEVEDELYLGVVYHLLG